MMPGRPRPGTGLLALAIIGCGGGEAGPSEAAPQIQSIAPVSAVAGENNFFFQVTGQRFHAGSVIRWNGVPVTTTFHDPETLSSLVGPGELRRAGVARISVDNGTGQGGRSGSRDFPVNYPEPVIGAVQPFELVAGSGATRLTVTGGRFFGATRVRWNGADRPTALIDPATLEVELSAGDLSTPAARQLTVFNPAPGGGSSAGITIAVTAPQSITAQRAVDLQVNALLGDPDRNRIIAATAVVDRDRPNAVVLIDGPTGAITATYPLAFEPLHLALSQDGRYLYAAAASEPVVSRIDLDAGLVDQSFAVDGFAEHEPSVAGGLAVVPGEPTAVLVAIRTLAVTPDHEGYVVFANGQPRPERLGRALRGHPVRAGNQPGILFGVSDPSSGPLTVFRLQVDGAGVRIAGQQSYPGLFGLEFEVDDGQLVFETGTAIDLATGMARGTLGLGAGGGFTADVASQRFYQIYPGLTRLAAYDLQRFAAVGAVTVPNIGLAQGSLVRWSRNGLAFRTLTQIIIVETTQAN